MSRAITVEDFLNTIELYKDEEWPLYYENEQINGMCDIGNNIVVYSYEVNKKLNDKNIDKELTVKDVYKYLIGKSGSKFIVDEVNDPIRSIYVNKKDQILELS